MHEPRIFVGVFWTNCIVERDIDDLSSIIVFFFGSLRKKIILSAFLREKTLYLSKSVLFIVEFE